MMSRSIGEIVTPGSNQNAPAVSTNAATASPNAAIPAAPQYPSHAIVTMNSGAKIDCNVLSFDGDTYVIQTPDGVKTSLQKDYIQNVAPVK